MSNTALLVEVPPEPRETKGRDPDHSRDLDRSMVRGLAWTTGAKGATQIVTWISTIFVARLLSPDDYGLFAMAGFYMGLVALCSDPGLGTAIIRFREMARDEVMQMNSLALAFGTVTMLATCAAAVPLGNFFNAPQLPLVMVAMSLSFLLHGLRIVPYAILQRDLSFQTLALSEAVWSLVQAGTIVALALLGFEYWSLVFGFLASYAVLTVWLVAARPTGFARPNFERLRGALQFSGHIFVTRIAWYLQVNSDFLVTGKKLGQTALGTYTMGWTLAGISGEKITALIGRVVPGFFSAVQTDRAALRRYLLRITEGLALAVFPIAIGMAIVADDMVLLALGSKWEAVIAPLRILCLYSCVRSITALLPYVLNVTGSSRFAMWVGIGAAVVFPVGFLIGSHWGTLGVAIAWFLLDPIWTIPTCLRVFRNLELSAWEYLKALSPALTGCFVMAAAVGIVRASLAPDSALALRFCVQLVIGASVYGLVVITFHRARIDEFVSLLKNRA